MSWSSRVTGLAAIAKRCWNYRNLALPWARSYNPYNFSKVWLFIYLEFQKM